MTSGVQSSGFIYYLLSHIYVVTFLVYKKKKGKKKTVIHTPSVHLLATLASLLLSDQTNIFLIFIVLLSGEKIGGAP